MQILNIGPFELGLILLLAFIVLGPDGMVNYSRKSAKWIAKVIRSPFWKELISTSEEVRSIPKQLIKDANLEESLKEINGLTRKPFELPVEHQSPTLETPKVESNTAIENEMENKDHQET
jgi:Sec-independent protein translocase protein TatA